MNNLKPIKLLPARERVASALRKAILVHDIPEGEELTLENVAEMLGVSSTPVREAFQMLSRDGFIKLRPNKGAIVMGINEKTIRDHYETRAVLEQECASQVCRKQADLSAIKAIVIKGETVISEKRYEDYSDINQAFHVALWEAGGNSKIQSILSEMWNGLSMGQNVTEASYAKLSHSEHKIIFKALEAGDPNRAGMLMKEHILRSLENILTHFDINMK